MNDEQEKLQLTDERKLELAIEQIADLKALCVTNAFMVQTMLECIGARPEPLQSAILKLNMGLGDSFENALRKKCGLEPRTESRPSMAEALEEAQRMSSIDWTKQKEH